MPSNTALSQEQVDQFEQNGYLVVKSLADPETLTTLQKAAFKLIKNPCEPWELEADTGYPGAPQSACAPGGQTIRRFLKAAARSSALSQWGIKSAMVEQLSSLLNTDELYLSQSHHNCLMTKTPAFSSDTGWHQDVRYWHFDRPNLVSAWTALGHESESNGGLSLIPGSHRTEFGAHQFDDAKFFIHNLPDNQETLNKAINVTLEAGDVLFFHCKLLHKASRNRSEQVKVALVYTYHDNSCSPIPNTRSSAQAELVLSNHCD